MTPLTRGEGGLLREDRSQPPLLVPLSLLGCKVHVEECAARDADAGSACYSGSSCRALEADPSCGGAALRGMVVDESMFAASAMEAGGELALDALRVPQLKEELVARDARRTGQKAALQRRLHALLVQAAIAKRAERDDETMADFEPQAAARTNAAQGEARPDPSEGTSGARPEASDRVRGQPTGKSGRRQSVVADSSDEDCAHTWDQHEPRSQVRRH